MVDFQSIGILYIMFDLLLKNKKNEAGRDRLLASGCQNYAGNYDTNFNIII